MIAQRIVDENARRRFGGPTRQGAGLEGRWLLHLQIQLMLQLPQGCEVLIQPYPISRPDRLQQGSTLLGYGRKRASASQNLRIRLEIRRVRISEIRAEYPCIERDGGDFSRIDHASAAAAVARIRVAGARHFQ